MNQGDILGGLKILASVVAIFLMVSSLAFVNISAQQTEISLAVDGNAISISTPQMLANINLADGSLSVGKPGQDTIVSLEFPMVAAYESAIDGALSLEESKYTSDLSQAPWELVSSKLSSTPAYGQYAEVVIETDIDLIPANIPEQNPNVPFQPPVELPEWGSFRIRFLVIERSNTFTSPSGAYNLTGLSEVKVDMGIILGSGYAPETICIKQKLVLANQSLHMNLLTPGGEVDLSKEMPNGPVPIPVMEIAEQSIRFKADGGKPMGQYNWVGFSEANGNDVPVSNFYVPTANGIDLYFCYNVPQGSTEIWHDPSISVNWDADAYIPPPTNIISEHKGLLATLAIAAGIMLSVAAIAARVAGKDPLDLDKNYYYRKNKK